MYKLLSVPLRRLAAEQGPPLGAALLIAELFYKFHSFTLECLAFLATWAILDAVIQRFVCAVRGEESSSLRQNSPAPEGVACARSPRN